VLNPRQLSLYLYLSLLTSKTGICHPTTKQIRQDLGLSSLTIVFDAMAVLEQHGFILRKRRNIEELNSRRNVYQRPACEFTILRLLDSGKIDGSLRPVPGNLNEMSDESRELKDTWLREALGDRYAHHESASDTDKRSILIEILEADLSGRAIA
jgi:SOS-response transcriptional repressor LexA